MHNYRTCQPSDREGSMCFEILGFDIILDKDCRPYLLEVNHAPSFNTDTPLDYLVKNDLIFDTLRLLGISIDEKK
jgi:tubulin polyglutamylase TTLL6/13